MATEKTETQVRLGYHFTVVPDAVIDDESLPTIPKLVFVVIARHASREGCAFPSLTRIAQKAGCSRSSAQEAIKILAAAGYLIKENRYLPGKNEYTSNNYVLQAPAAVEISESVPPSGIGVPGGGIGVPPSGKEVDVLEVDPSKNKQQAPASLQLGKDAAVSTGKSFGEEVREAGLSMPPGEILAVEEKLRSSGIKDPARFAAWLREHVESRNPKNPAGYYRRALLEYEDLRARFLAGERPAPPSEDEQREVQNEHRRKLAEEVGYHYEPLDIPKPGPVAEDVSGLGAIEEAARSGNKACLDFLEAIRSTPVELAAAV